ncbi:MAG: extracellular solute-binding protein [Propionibacteriaceae bacterium]|jgi:ABC-type glycerol-3-phosphate transport system substrate-binding protein|nr:extracellular solute-binding protein [Propionibacteriaceae bacterium]
MNTSTKRGLALLAGASSLAMLLSACSSNTPNSTTSGSPAGGDSGGSDQVTLTVVGLKAGSTPEAYQGLADQVADFQSKNPGIKIVTMDYEWKATTFAADLAGGTLPDVYEIPFTDSKTLAANNQIADMNDYLSQFPYGGAFNASVLQYGKGTDGHVYAIPAKSIYGIGLHYNRDLFTQAGLDPDKPPTTWDELRTAAKAITDKTGQAGFCQMTSNGTGGWQLTVDTYARGGSMETLAADGTATATVNNDATKAALQFLKDLRWTDNAMGANFTYDWGSINQAFAAGQCGMYTSGQDVYVSLVQSNGMDPKIYGLTMIPLDGSKAGVLGGGTLAAVNTKTSDAQKEAAVKWISYFYLDRYSSESAAVANAKLTLANDQPVGVPELPIFSDQDYANYQQWIKPYVNVPLDQMTNFTSKIGAATLINEPPVATQDVYASLDPAVQAVLTDQNADVSALLDEANTTAQRAIDKAASGDEQ